MKRLICAVALGGALMTLVGCGPQEPMVFGVPQSQWNTLSAAEKKQVIQGYNQRQKIDAQNAPINNAIGAASDIIQENNSYRRMQGNMTPPPMPPAPNFNPPPMPHF